MSFLRLVQLATISRLVFAKTWSVAWGALGYSRSYNDSLPLDTSTSTSQSLRRAICENLAVHCKAASPTHEIPLNRTQVFLPLLLLLLHASQCIATMFPLAHFCLFRSERWRSWGSSRQICPNAARRTYLILTIFYKVGATDARCL